MAFKYQYCTLKRLEDKPKLTNDNIQKTKPSCDHQPNAYSSRESSSKNYTTTSSTLCHLSFSNPNDRQRTYTWEGEDSYTVTKNGKAPGVDQVAAETIKTGKNTLHFTDCTCASIKSSIQNKYHWYGEKPLLPPIHKKVTIRTSKNYHVLRSDLAFEKLL